MTARIVQTSSIAHVHYSCCCGAELHGDLDEDMRQLIESMFILHRICLGLDPATHDERVFEEQSAEVEDSY